MSIKAKNLDYIDYSRAIAIIFIVAGHSLCWGQGKIRDINSLIFAGGTYFFVFIAGYLFYYLSYKFERKEYFKKKLINVICPYIITLLPVALLYSCQNIDNWAFQPANFGMRLFAVLSGSYIVNAPTWFIGMIVIMFLFSPYFLKSWNSKKNRIVLLLLSLIFCISIPRESSVNMFIGFNPYKETILHILVMNILFYIRCFLHFSFFYLLGMEISLYIERKKDNIKMILKDIGMISLILYLVHFVLNIFILNIPYSRGMETVSKTIELFVILSGLLLFEDSIRCNFLLDKFLKFVAKYSFGIFFIHGYIINLFYYHTLYTQRNFDNFFTTNLNTVNAFINALIIFLSSLIGSILILWIIKKFLKLLGIKNTRMIIGV